MFNLDELAQVIMRGNRVRAKELTQEALDQGVAAKDIITRGYIVGMKKIGELFGAGAVFLPEVLLSSRAMKESMEIVLPILSASNFEYVANFAIGTVRDDIHDIGKNIVAAVFSGCGFHVRDLGVNVPSERFTEAIEEGAQVIGLSALIGPTMPNLGFTIEAIVEAGLRSKVKIIVGGPLVTKEYAEKIGADAYGEDAFSGVKKTLALLGRS